MVIVCFSPFCRRAPFLGTLADINKYIDQRLWRWCITFHRDPVGECGGGSLTGDSEGKMNFQGMGYRRFCRQVSLSVGVPLGNLGRGLFTRSFER
jgi:hypothetical protein